ncbi:MAG: aldehyde dehydrogenase family protein [Planctomycetes bacterium]|nr:aldehyde dehydrogenase family protein [Planctomycetota bacterium]
MPPVATAPGVEFIEDVDPSSGDVLARIPCADAEQVRQAVARAKGAQRAWAGLGIDARVDVLQRVAAHFDDPSTLDRLAALITSEMGKPIAQARREAAACAGGIRRLATATRDALVPIEAREDGTVTRITREPLGVVAAITPWNFPLGMAREVIVPALAAGNAVVFKPSDVVPLTGAALAELFAAELPADVLVLVQGRDATGKALVAADVDMVGFVGSVAAGRHIMAACAPTLKRLVLELGGKDPMLVCADADLEKAADFAVRESMRNTGQVCCSVERIYVERPVAERFAELCAERARALVAGDPRGDVFMGPMSNAGQMRQVLAQIDDARAKGARVLTGGTARAGRGFFVEPTVVTDVDESMELLREETFGPVATIRPVDSAEQALALANDSPFGLGASVWCGDPQRARSLASRLESGQVGVNRGLGGAGDPPWAGVKQSGFGFLGSPDGYRMFTRPLSISWDEA